MRKRLILFVCFALTSVVAAAQSAWYQSFTPTRTVNVSSMTQLESALAAAQPGDLIRLATGNYTKSFLQITRNGTATKPIVIRPAPGARATFHGLIDVGGSYVWLWGLEVVDSICGAPGRDSAMTLRGIGTRAINNVIHGGSACNGIGAWKAGKGQIIYGNLIYGMNSGPSHPHSLYTQNDFKINGYKYIVGNMLLDPAADGCSNCFTIHAYGETLGATSGFHMQHNIFRNGRFMIGNTKVGPATNNLVLDNYFYGNGVELGFGQIGQGDVRRNYIGKVRQGFIYWWGTGEAKYSNAPPGIFTDNTVYLSRDFYTLQFRTAAYLTPTATKPTLRTPRLRSTDQVDRNTYYGNFLGKLEADNKITLTKNLPDWRKLTLSAGKQYDTNSTFTAGRPPGSKTVVLKNEYDPTSGFLAIYRWTVTSNVAVTLSGITPEGSTVYVYDAKAIWSAPVRIAQVVNGRITVPTPAEHNAYYLRFEGNPQITRLEGLNPFDSVKNLLDRFLPMVSNKPEKKTLRDIAR
jgi:Chondroitinase B